MELDDLGLGPTEVALQLDIDVSAVAPLLRVARAKLVALEALDEPSASSNGKKGHHDAR
jgi:hypothetical protein